VLDLVSCDLGCGAHWAWQVRTREGGLVCAATDQELGWKLSLQRRLDQTGEVTLVIDANCCSCLDDIETGDELWLHRNGLLAWVGPITKATRQAPFGEAVLVSNDRSWWLGGRFFGFPVDWTNRDAGLNVFDILAANAAVDPLTALVWEDAPPGNLLGVNLSLTPTISVTFGSVMQTLAESVMDWTVLGAAFLAATEGVPVPALPLLTSDSWDDGRFTTVQDHNDYASQVIVEGKEGIVAYWPPLVTTPPFRPPPNPRWGNRDAYISDANLADYAACLTRAQTEYGLRNPPPRRLAVPNGALIDEAICFEQLVPGAAATVAAPSTCDGTTLIAMLLATVAVEVSAGEELSVSAALVEKGVPVATT
jgi:hypothetical protein